MKAAPLWIFASIGFGYSLARVDGPNGWALLLAGCLWLALVAAMFETTK